MTLCLYAQRCEVIQTCIFFNIQEYNNILTEKINNLKIITNIVSYPFHKQRVWSTLLISNQLKADRWSLLFLLALVTHKVNQLW